MSAWACCAPSWCHKLHPRACLSAALYPNAPSFPTVHLCDQVWLLNKRRLLLRPRVQQPAVHVRVPCCAGLAPALSVNRCANQTAAGASPLSLFFGLMVPASFPWCSTPPPPPPPPPPSCQALSEVCTANSNCCPNVPKCSLSTSGGAGTCQTVRSGARLWAEAVGLGAQGKLYQRRPKQGRRMAGLGWMLSASPLCRHRCPHRLCCSAFPKPSLDAPMSSTAAPA